MPRSEEIPRQEWIEFLDEFTREHQGRQVDMEVLGSDIGAQTEAHDMPLQGVSADVRKAGEHDVSIVVGDEQNPPLTHIVPQARHLRIERTDTGNDDTLEIEAADGSKTLLHLRLPRAA